jgi:hypothetical protein
MPGTEAPIPKTLSHRVAMIKREQSSLRDLVMPLGEERTPTGLLPAPAPTVTIRKQPTITRHDHKVLSLEPISRHHL